MVVSAPEALEAQPEGRGSGAMIVVRPVIPATPKPQPKEWTGPGVAPGPLPQPQPK
jgi:hypothetical protein